MNKSQMIEALIADDIDRVFIENEHYNSTEWISQIFYHGFRGYESFNMDELEAECRERGLYDDGENIDIDINKTGGKW